LRRRSQKTDPLPDPSDYGPRTDQALGEDLLDWLQSQASRVLFPFPPWRRQKKALLLASNEAQRIAKMFAASRNRWTACFGEVLLTAQRGNLRLAGKMYRAMCAAGQSLPSQLARLKKQLKDSKAKLAELEAAALIRRKFDATGRNLNASELARLVIKKLGCGQLTTVRRHVADFAHPRKGRSRPKR
jgi:hypothetical protein